jgi:hypothetical protein
MRSIDRRVQKRLDLLLLGVGELLPAAAEDLDAVVRGRIVRRRDDGAEVEGEQRDRGCREHAAENRVPARRDDAPGERFL